MFLPILPVLLALSTTPSEANKDCFVPSALGTSPENFPADMSLPAAEPREGGVFLPRSTAAETAWRLRCLWAWPKACQSALVAQRKADAAVAEIRLRQIEELRLLAARPGPSTGFPPWVPVAVGVGALVLGGLAGYGVAKITN